VRYLYVSIKGDGGVEIDRWSFSASASQLSIRKHLTRTYFIDIEVEVEDQSLQKHPLELHRLYLVSVAHLLKEVSVSDRSRRAVTITPKYQQ